MLLMGGRSPPCPGCVTCRKGGAAMSVDAVRIDKLPAAAKLSENTVVVAVNPDGAAVSLTYGQLMQQLRADLLGGRTVSPTPGQVMEVTLFPGISALRNQGYVPQDTQTGNSEAYFEGLLRYLIEHYPKGGMFVGRATPGTEGVCLIDIYAQGAVEGLPTHSTGTFFELGYTITRFGTSNGKYSLKRT